MIIIPIMDIRSICAIFPFVGQAFPTNSIRKNYFLAACKALDENVNLQEANDERPHGGTIGIGNSRLHNIFRTYKVMRLHAIFHDAAGFMKYRYNIGPGYSYVFPGFPINSCFIGHVSGLIYCTYLKFASPFYRIICC